MATSWSCADGHTHELNRVATTTPDPFSAQGLGLECITCGDRIVGIDYPFTVKREWTASTRATAAAS
jgi:hypothetical protein